VNRLKIQRLESRRKTRDIYNAVGCLMPYRLCALTSAQLKLSSVRFMQHCVARAGRVMFCEAGMRKELFIVDGLPACRQSYTMERQKSKCSTVLSLFAGRSQ